MSKKINQWQVPNQLKPNVITGKAETLEVPQAGLMNWGRYHPHDRPKIGLGPLSDISQYQQVGPASAFEQLLEAPSRPTTPQEQEMQQEAKKRTSTEVGSGVGYQYRPWQPMFPAMDTPFIDEPTIPVQTNPYDVFNPTYEHDKGGGPKKPKLYKPQPVPQDPPRKPKILLTYYTEGALSIQVSKKKRRRKFPQSPVLRKKNRIQYGSYRGKTYHSRWPFNT